MPYACKAHQRVKALRTDGGGEYTGESTQRFLRERGIKYEMTTADTPQHNGVAERMNRTLVETTRTLLADADLPNTYWYDAVEYAAYLHNIVPTRSLDDDLTPEEAWSGNKPNVSLVRIFGSKVSERSIFSFHLCTITILPPSVFEPSTSHR